MAAATQLDAQLRTKTGKGASRALRREGRVPAVLYGGTEDPVHFSLNPIQLHKELHQTGFLSKIFEIPLNNKKEKALAREVHFHPVTDLPLHVDFMRVAKGGKITVSVPLQFLNEEKSPGLKKGGVLNILVHNLDIIADVDHIPSHLEIDLTGREIHDTIHLTDIILPTGAVAAHPERDNSLASIVAPTVMKRETTAEETTTEEETEASEKEEAE